MQDKSSISSAKEVEKFNKLANEWWDPNGGYKTLYRFNHARLEFIYKHIRRHFQLSKDDSLQDISILDVGCGGGFASVPLCQSGALVTGVDASELTIQVAKHYANKLNLDINYIHSTVEDIHKYNHNKKFKVILALDIIEHVNNPLAFIESLSTHLETNGLIFISTINKTVASAVFAKFMAEYVLRWVPKGTHEINKFVSPKQLESILNKNNFSDFIVEGIVYSLFNNQWKLAKNTAINYIATGIKK